MSRSLKLVRVAVGVPLLRDPLFFGQRLTVRGSYGKGENLARGKNADLYCSSLFLGVGK